jgi:ubiquinol-cytochrome c reductase cytochrome c subunit
MTRRRRLGAIAGLALGLAALGAGCSALTQSGPQPYHPPGLSLPVIGPDAGRVLFQRDCAWCHGAQGQGTVYGPNLNGPLDGGAYTDFMLRTGRMPLGYPSEPATRRTPTYTDQEISAIVAYVESLGGTGPAVPQPDPAAGNLATGATLYQQDCAACHSTTGFGGALTGGQVVPSLWNATPQEVAEAMAVGPGCPNTSRTCGPGEGAMPRFQLSAQDVNAITRYVEYLQSPSDRGGEPIDHVGPVAEGAVGLIVGVGLLIGVVRWIGTTEREEEESEP